MKKLLIDCSFISTTKLNTGIQRVVRKIVENIEDICKNTQYEPMQVVLKDGKINEISLNHKKEISSFSKNIEVSKGDILLLLDSTWHLDTWESISEAKISGAMIVAVIYDIIPISHPEFCDVSLVKLFNQWFSKAINYVDGFITISATVEKDLYNYLSKKYSKETESKFFSHFLLGADFEYKNFDIQSTNVREELITLYTKNKSIYLIVCTLEPRKNHKYLLDVFDKLWKQNIDVTLNIVGRKGWMVDDLIDRIHSHEQYNSRLFHWDNLNDEELNYCYQNSKMLLFPSFIEGFGLPIIESLNNALPVLASNIPIHREVGSDKIGYFDLSSSDDLKEKIIGFEKNGIPSGLILEDGFKWLNWHQSTQKLFYEIEKFDKKFKIDYKAIKKLKSSTNETTLKQKIKSVPLLGWFVRWSYNLLRLNNIKHSLFILQNQVNLQQTHINHQQTHINHQQAQINELILQNKELSLQIEEIISKKVFKQLPIELEEMLPKKVKEELKVQVPKEVAQEMFFQAETLQQRVDRFIVDTKIDLKNKNI